MGLSLWIAEAWDDTVVLSRGRATKQAVAKTTDRVERRKLASVGLEYTVVILRDTITCP